MKVRLEYRYKQENSFPYVAFAYVNDLLFTKCSNFSFEEAKQEVLADVKAKMSKSVPEIPEEEEVEL